MNFTSLKLSILILSFLFSCQINETEISCNIDLKKPFILRIDSPAKSCQYTYEINFNDEKKLHKAIYLEKLTNGQILKVHKEFKIIDKHQIRKINCIINEIENIKDKKDQVHKDAWQYTLISDSQVTKVFYRGNAPNSIYLLSQILQINSKQKIDFDCF